MRIETRTESRWPPLLSIVLFELAFLLTYRFAVAFRQNAPLTLSVPDAILLCGLLLMLPSVRAYQKRKADAKLTPGEHGFESILEEAPIMLWTAGADGRCAFFNKSWLDFTGLSLQDQTEQDWVARIHPADRERSVTSYLSAFKSRKNFAMEYRLLRRDDVYAWVFHNGVPRYASDGGFIGYIGCRFDLSDRVDAEKYLREASIELIAAEKTERYLVGQELHDDLAQKIAALSMGLGRFRCNENRHLTAAFDEMQRQLSDVCRHMVRLSDQLRPITVEGRGLSSALRVLCERATSKGREILLVQSGNLPRLPEDHSKAIYDVAEESIRNALTHSKATHILVELKASATTLRLSVRDNGCGFVVEDIQKPGLGLTTMATCIRNAGGEFRIISHPGEGTTITVTFDWTVVD